MIRNVKIDNAAAICEIYKYYIENTINTFEEEPVSIGEMQSRIEEVISIYPWLVFEKDGKVVGYAFANRWKSRRSYRYSAESTVYLSKNMTGQGIGRKLYEALISELCTLGIHSVIGGIALPNPASVALHEKLGFETVAHFKEVGRKFDQWIDVGYWELIIKNAEQAAAADIDRRFR
jgi:phosphinothricin acetyltransferase